MIKKIFVFLLFTVIIYAQNESNYSKKSNSMDFVSAMSVTVGGSFIVTGTFPAAPGERVDQFVTRLLNEAKSEKLAVVKDYDKQQEILRDFEKIAQRNIKLIKNTGSVQIIDLEKFRLTGDYKI